MGVFIFGNSNIECSNIYYKTKFDTSKLGSKYGTLNYHKAQKNACKAGKPN